jgi:hemolysin III
MRTIPKESQKKLPPLPFQTPGEEIANSILHGIGWLLAVAGLVLLTLRANGFIGGRGGGSLAVASYVMYTASLICMFLISTLYHAIEHEKAKQVFRILDHSAIYLLIAGTYTPLCLTALRGTLGWSLFAAEWGLAVLGIVLYAVNYKPLKKIEVIVYILMGWAIVIGWSSLSKVIPQLSLILLIAVGVAYTLGTIWYIQKVRRGTHVTWHVFVLVGAVCHWFSVWFMS